MQEIKPDLLIEKNLALIISINNGLLGSRKTWEDTCNSAAIQDIFKELYQKISHKKPIGAKKITEDLYQKSPINDLETVTKAKEEDLIPFDFVRYFMIGQYVIKYQKSNYNEAIEIRQSDVEINNLSLNRFSLVEPQKPYLIKQTEHTQTFSYTTPMNELYYGDKFSQLPNLLEINISDKGIAYTTSYIKNQDSNISTQMYKLYQALEKTTSEKDIIEEFTIFLSKCNSKVK